MSSSTEPQSHPHEIHKGGGLPSIGDMEAIESMAGKPVEETLKCPSCNSNCLFKDGLRKLADGFKVQRYLCRDCGYRFTEPSGIYGKIHKTSNLTRAFSFEGNEDEDPGQAGSGSDMGGGLMLEKPLEVEKRPAGGTEVALTSSSLGTISVIDRFAWWLKKNGYADLTIKGSVKLLKTLTKRGANLYDPESVKDVIARQPWSIRRKEIAVYTYSSFLEMVGGKWDPPKYKSPKKLPFIPTEEEIDQLIAGCNKKTAVFLQLLKETGMRCGEAWQLEWTDVDFENEVVKVTAEKGGEPRVLKISRKLIAMLNTLPRDNDKVFGGLSLDGFRRNFQKQREKVAYKLQNPRVSKITFHTLRHWKGTMEYYRTKDILHVMKTLGHKNINNTLIYIQLVNFERDDFYTCRVAKTVDEAVSLVEAGFEYVCEMQGFKLFRKRK